MIIFSSKDALLLLCGASNTGKTTILKEVIYDLVSKKSYKRIESFFHPKNDLSDFDEIMKFNASHVPEYTVLLEKNGKYIMINTFGDYDEEIYRRISRAKEYAIQRKIEISLFVTALSVPKTILENEELYAQRRKEIGGNIKKYENTKIPTHQIIRNYDEIDSLNKKIVEKIVTHIEEIINLEEGCV